MTTYLQCAQKGQDSIMYSIIDFIQKMPEVIYVGYLWYYSYKDFSQNRSFMIQFISTLTSGTSVNRDCGVILLTSLYWYWNDTERSCKVVPDRQIFSSTYDLPRIVNLIPVTKSNKKLLSVLQSLLVFSDC